MSTQNVNNKIELNHLRRLGKSVAHAEIQHHLKNQIPDLELEKKVGNRRADAVWEAKKIVFEIQLSPLTHEEASQRSRDYNTSGYQIVWILHEGEFNQRKVGPAERFLRQNHPTYFTNGAHIYDQIEVFDGNVRRFQGEKLQVQIASPSLPFLEVPDRVWPLHFVGDLHTFCAIQGREIVNKIFKQYRPAQGLRWWLQFVGWRVLEVVSKNAK